LAKLKALVRNEPYLKDLVNEAGYTLPLLCAEKNYVDAMEMFIGENIDCMEVTMDNTIFHQAAAYGSLETLKLLLDHMPDALNLKNNNMNTCLHLGCACNRIEIVQFLLEHDKIQVNAQNKHGDTPLHRSCWFKYIKIISVLLKNQSINVSIRNKGGKLPDEFNIDVNIKRMIKKKRSQK